MNTIRMETKLFNHGNPRIRSTRTHMNYELGRLIVKHGAEFGGDSVKIFQPISSHRVQE